MSLFECPHNNLVDSYSCHSSNDASVRCQGKQNNIILRRLTKRENSKCVYFRTCMFMLFLIIDNLHIQYCVVLLLSIHTARDLITFTNCSDGEVRLVGGVMEYEGRVEICVNGAWGTICSETSYWIWYNTWTTTDSRVVCRQLGHQEYGNKLVV